MVDGERGIIADPPLIVPIEDLCREGRQRDEVEEELRGILRSYRRTLETDRRHLLEDFDFVHMARKVVGVGSVGTRAWILLMLGRDDQDPLFLQAKEAEESVLERFVGKSQYPNHGQRVVAGQRLMQAASDIFLGWERVTGIDGQARDFYIRQLRDWKGSADVDTMAASGDDAVRPDLRGDPRPRPRPLRRPDRHRLLPGQQRRLRPRHRRLLRRLRRPERTRLPSTSRSREVRPDHCTNRPVRRERTSSGPVSVHSQEFPAPPTEGTGGTEADVIQHDHHTIKRLSRSRPILK